LRGKQGGLRMKITEAHLGDSQPQTSSPVSHGFPK